MREQEGAEDVLYEAAAKQNLPASGAPFHWLWLRLAWSRSRSWLSRRCDADGGGAGRGRARLFHRYDNPNHKSAFVATEDGLIVNDPRGVWAPSVGTQLRGSLWRQAGSARGHSSSLRCISKTRTAPLSKRGCGRDCGATFRSWRANRRSLCRSTALWTTGGGWPPASMRSFQSARAARDPLFRSFGEGSRRLVGEDGLSRGTRFVEPATGA
jgi:hypothetical protein